jgi:hypothetical protein
VPRCLGGGVKAGETAEHVQVFLQRSEVVVHEPPYALERLDAGLAEVARDRPGPSAPKPLEASRAAHAADGAAGHGS